MKIVIISILYILSSSVLFSQVNKYERTELNSNEAQARLKLVADEIARYYDRILDEIHEQIDAKNYEVIANEINQRVQRIFRFAEEYFLPKNSNDKYVLLSIFPNDILIYKISEGKKDYKRMNYLGISEYDPSITLSRMKEAETEEIREFYDKIEKYYRERHPALSPQGSNK